jgi:hypothetical protein
MDQKVLIFIACAVFCCCVICILAGVGIFTSTQEEDVPDPTYEEEEEETSTDDTGETAEDTGDETGEPTQEEGIQTGEGKGKGSGETADDTGELSGETDDAPEGCPTDVTRYALVSKDQFVSQMGTFSELNPEFEQDPKFRSDTVYKLDFDGYGVGQSSMVVPCAQFVTDSSGTTTWRGGSMSLKDDAPQCKSTVGNPREETAYWDENTYVILPDMKCAGSDNYLREGTPVDLNELPVIGTSNPQSNNDEITRRVCHVIDPGKTYGRYGRSYGDASCSTTKQLAGTSDDVNYISI